MINFCFIPYESYTYNKLYIRDAMSPNSSELQNSNISVEKTASPSVQQKESFVDQQLQKTTANSQLNDTIKTKLVKRFFLYN